VAPFAASQLLPEMYSFDGPEHSGNTLSASDAFASYRSYDVTSAVIPCVATLDLTSFSISGASSTFTAGEEKSARTGETDRQKQTRRERTKKDRSFCVILLV
jgi:hypothetical protein